MAQKIETAKSLHTSLIASDFAEKLTLEDAEQVQRLLNCHPNFKIGSWKLGASTHSSRAALSLNDCFVGAIEAAHTMKAPSTFRHSCLRARLVECEIAFRMNIKAWLSQPEADATSFIESVHPAFELPESRFEKIGGAGTAALVADYGAAGYAVLGPGIDFAEFDTAGFDIGVQLFLNGALQNTGDTSALVMEPLDLLRSQMNRFAHYKNLEEVGDYILLGSLTPPQHVSPNDVVRAEFGRLGSVEIHIEQ